MTLTEFLICDKSFIQYNLPELSIHCSNDTGKTIRVIITDILPKEAKPNRKILLIKRRSK